MKCPRCENVELVLMVRQGIEIDFCPQCKGAWLDHGELDRIILRTFPSSLKVREKHHSTPDLKYDPHHAKKHD